MQLFRRICASLTTICFLALGMTAPANAALIGTDAYLNSVERAERVAAVEAALARDDVRAQLERMGVDADEAVARVAHLTEAELATVAKHLEELPAGGDALAVIGIVFLVLLILELVGVTNIFNRI